MLRHASPSQTGRASKALLAGATLVLIAATGLLLWEPWRTVAPGGPAGLDGSGADPNPSALAADSGAEPDAQPRGAEREPVNDAAGARDEVVAHTVLRGSFRPPAGVWPGGGHVELYPALEMPPGGFLGAMGEMMATVRKTGKADNNVRVTNTGARMDFETLFGPREAVVRKALDPYGAFELHDPPAGNYEVHLHHAHLRPAGKTEVAIALGDERDLGVLDTSLAGSLLVLVSDGEGHPVAQAVVQLGKKLDMNQFADPKILEDMAGLMRNFVPEKGRTDERGACLFKGLTDEVRILSVQSKDKVEELREVRPLPGRENLVRVELSSGAVLAVRVFGTDRAPVASAKLRVSSPDAAAAGPAMRSAMSSPRTHGRTLRTNQDGVATARGLPPGRTTVRLATPGYLPEQQEVQLESDRTRTIDLRLAVGASVSGRVLDEDGQPLAAAHVMHLGMLSEKFMGMDLGSLVGVDMLSLGIEKRGIAVDADGSFTHGGFKPNQEANLIAAATGYDPARIDTVAGDRDVEFRLLRSTQMTGVVVAEPNGEPIEDFEVRLEQRAWLVFDRPVVLERFAAREDGTFTVSSVPRDRFNAVVKAAGRADWTKRVDFGEGSIDLGEIRLTLPAAIEGVTVDPDGRPLSGVSVRVSKGGAVDSIAMASFFGRTTVKSDDEGRFRLEGLSGRRVRLLADLQGYAPLKSSTIRIQKGQTTADIVLRLSRGGSVRGTIVDDEGAPQGDWRVQVSELSGRSFHSTLADANGAFHLTGLASGSHKVEAFPPDYMDKFGSTFGRGDPESSGFNFSEMMETATKWVVRDNVVIREGEEAEVQLVFEPPEEGTTEGLVEVSGIVRVGGVPLESGMISTFRVGSPAPRIVPVRNGRFELSRVRPGTLRVQVQEGLFSAVVGQPCTVTVPDAKTHELTIDLPGGRLEGRVLQEDDGKPVAGVVLSLESTGGTTGVVHDRADLGEGSLLTDAEGRFRFDGLAAGSYDIFAKELLLRGGSGRSGRLADVALGASERRTGLELVMRKGGSLHVTVRDNTGPRAGALVTLLREDGQPLPLFQRALTDADGMVTLSALPQGRYRASVDAPRAAARLSELVDLQPGAERTVAVALQPGVEVIVEVGGEIPRQAAGAMVAYSVWGPDGGLMRSGRFAVPRTITAGQQFRLGEYAPGRYRVRLEGSAGVVQRDQNVPEVGRVILEVNAGELLR